MCSSLACQQPKAGALIIPCASLAALLLEAVLVQPSSLPLVAWAGAGATTRMSWLVLRISNNRDSLWD